MEVFTKANCSDREGFDGAGAREGGGGVELDMKKPAPRGRFEWSG